MKKSWAVRWGTAAPLAQWIMLGLSPTFAVVILPTIFQWGDVFSPVLDGTSHPDEIPAVLDSISSDLGSLAVATTVGIGTVLGSAEKAWRRRPVAWAAVAGVLFSIASIYSGIRFRFAMVEQLVIAQIDIDRLGDRLVAQGLMLLLSVGIMLGLSVHRFFPEFARKPNQ